MIVKLGEQQEFVFSQKAIENINRLLKLLKTRLACSSTKNLNGTTSIDTSI